MLNKANIVTHSKPKVGARSVGKAELKATPAAQAAAKLEWDRLVASGVFDMSVVRGWSEVRSEARQSGETIHHGSIATIVVEKGAELPLGHPDRKFKGRAVFLGDNVRDQDFNYAVFVDLGSAPPLERHGT